MSHLVRCYKCNKCGFVNQAEPSNANCSAWFGCDFEKGKFSTVDVPLQAIRKEEKQKEDKENQDGAFALLWIGHAIVVGLSKGAAKGFLALLFGPFMWFF
ncbi:hypothetical protein QX776_14160 [Alteromonadaceae bacterium BrNp21-10]|nr:hypothetical protein [Alteromonadaceae bacterium BrNp21-10]